ncbi:RING-H2 finger protein ATL46 [Ananas comosus]|uniref:RING-type E3 ubiquitin transferase n=1 Tax=Ananas comosus TaxID=4615 RepID=A0A199UPA0_ANACO|nr:RING-H2 finger protein ATL46 [Ananas comosus]
MVFVASSPSNTNWVLSQFKRKYGFFPQFAHSYSHQLTSFQRDTLPYSSIPPPPTPPSPTTRISPAVLFIIVILAVIFFVSGLLHLVVRILIKKNANTGSRNRPTTHQEAEVSGSDALQRQLRQLFHLHDSGLDQTFIDSLPVFLYKEILGPKEPFDCAVCLCEFAEDDKLRLLPVCGHAFHLSCIDTWLLSNSSCPLCRAALFSEELDVEDPIFDFEDIREEERDGFSFAGQKAAEPGEVVAEKRVLPVRLGKFRNLSKCADDNVVDNENNNDNSNDNGIVRREEGESSSSNLDARRCYSMGSYQYVLGDVNLHVSLRHGVNRNGNGRIRRDPGVNGVSMSNDALEGRKICARSKGESFSVSKIWQWSNNKGNFPITSSDAPYIDRSLPWVGRSVGIHKNVLVFDNW